MTEDNMNVPLLSGIEVLIHRPSSLKNIFKNNHFIEKH